MKQNSKLEKQLKMRIDELECFLGENLWDDEVVLLPIRYLIFDEPYQCGIASCKKRFSTYNLLSKHAFEHSLSSIGL